MKFVISGIHPNKKKFDLRFLLYGKPKLHNKANR
jgi:hypothetical protein